MSELEKVRGMRLEQLSAEDLVALHDQLIAEIEEVEEEMELRR